MRDIITEISSREELVNLIKENKGILVLKFGAEWCGPCKKIEQTVIDWFNILPANVTCGIIDCDESFDVYAFYKKHKIVKTIPAILRFDSENEHWAPDDAIFSSDSEELNIFFQKIINDA
tara:strand:+ start:3821 stop:4180 length:360 start_codon:yes stop_codon:yes gene_type:complete